MKLFIVVETYSDDDGNLGTTLHYCNNEEEAFQKVKEIHDDTLDTFTSYADYDESEVEDDYNDGDSSFEMYLVNDCAVCTNVRIEAKEF